MKHITCIFLLMVCSSLSSQENETVEITLLTGIGTYHMSENPAHNNDNHIVGFLYNRWFITHYKNSHLGESWGLGYALGNWQYLPNPDSPFMFRTRMWTGVATGYGDRLLIHWGPLTLAFLPEFSTELELSEHWSTGFSGLYIPTDAGGVWVNGIQLSYRY